MPIEKIIVRVKGGNKYSTVQLDTKDKLRRIREILEKDENIKMDDKLLFFNSTDSTPIKREEESRHSLKDIINNNILCIMSDTKKNIRVKVEENNVRSSLVRLDTKDKLQRIREILEEDENIKMDNELLFINSTNSNHVERNKESDCSLNDIITNDNNSLILKKSKKSLIQNLQERLKLGYGRILTPDKIKIEISKEKLVETLKFEELHTDDTKNRKDVNFNSKKCWANKISKFFNSDDEIMNYGPKGLSFSDEQNQTEKKSYVFTKIPKSILKLKIDDIKPTDCFVEKVKNALSKTGDFDEIYKNFGQFIPTEVVLGGVYYETNSEVILIGGNPQSTEDKNEYNLEVFKRDKRDNWIKSLEKSDTWECIEFRNPKSIFQLLDVELREEVNKFFGKKILYKNVKSLKFRLQYRKYGNKEKIKLPLNDDISRIINDEKAECSVFATVVDDEEKNDSLNCQIYHPKNEMPQLIIHCFQKKQKWSNLHELKIAFMIVGYDIHFNLNNFNDFNGFNKMKLEVRTDDTFDQKDGNCSFLGIPVLKELNDDPIVIGHYFSKYESKIKANVFAYNLKEKKYVEKSNFSFRVLTISENPGTIKFMKSKNYNKYEDFSKFSISMRKEYVFFFFFFFNPTIIN
jgi:hypothetical protein